MASIFLLVYPKLSPAVLLMSAVYAFARKDIFVLLIILFSTAGLAASPLMLANVYSPGIALDDYFVSEKLDGVRGYWDGKKLYTRAGNIVNAPAWFTKNWPDYAMDGELWAGRGKFTQASSTVRQLNPDDIAWRKLRFMVFDLPAEPGVFAQRYIAMQERFEGLSHAHLQMVSQVRVVSHSALMQQLDAVVKVGGEGLMLHRGQSLYRAERTDDLLKVKPYEDAEAQVVAHLPGKGKYTGMMGALLVESPQGLRFKIGTGFTDVERKNPPKIGSVITYRYRGLHDSGIPRFASFMRIREPEK